MLLILILGQEHDETEEGIQDVVEDTLHLSNSDMLILGGAEEFLATGLVDSVDNQSRSLEDNLRLGCKVVLCHRP
jgi:hypothetical protein